jgi:hypothetical protein
MGSQPAVRPAIRVWRMVVRAGRVVVIGITVVLALLGALVGPPAAALIWAPAVGLVAAAVVGLVNPNFPTTAGARRAAVLAGAGGFLAVPFTSGLGLLDGAGALLVVLQLVLGALWVVDWIANTPESTGSESVRHDITYLRRVLPDLPVEVLLREWRTSADLLRPDVEPATRSAAAELRALLLDELSRRDPEAVEEWLRTGGADPDQYLPRGSGPGL